MRILLAITIAAFVAGCAGSPDRQDAFYRAQASCGQYALIDEGPTGSGEQKTRQDETSRCLSREYARNDDASIAFKAAFNDAVSAR